MAILLIRSAVSTATSEGLLLTSQACQRRCLHTSNVLCKKKAGRYHPTPRRTQPLTYEQAQKPDMIGVRKSWLSINTSGLFTGIRPAETTHEDLFIRKFIHGTWPQMVASEVIIKRRANLIDISFISIRKLSSQKYYFMIGYTEEILSLILKCIVKLDIRTVVDQDDLTYQRI